jgi:hypothetical protein
MRSSRLALGRLALGRLAEELAEELAGPAAVWLTEVGEAGGVITLLIK